MTHDVVTLTLDDREHLLARAVPAAEAHAVARAHCGLPPDAAGVVEDGPDTVYHGAGDVFAAVTPHAQPRTRLVTRVVLGAAGTLVGTWRE